VHEKKCQRSFKMTVESFAMNYMGPMQMTHDSWHFYSHLEMRQYINLTRKKNLGIWHGVICLLIY
jgi:hypothetical protein